MEWLNTQFFHSSIKQWLLCTFSFLFIYFSLSILKRFFQKKLSDFSKKTNTKFDDALVALIRQTNIFFFLATSLYFSSHLLNLTKKWESGIEIIALIFGLVQIAFWGRCLVDFSVGRYKANNLESDAANVTTISSLGFLVKIILYSVLLLAALDNLGVDVTAMIAGLGVGGIAIALAAQNILGDLFASLSIVMDKPFVIGDFIIVGDLMGVVEKIGLKTTRIRSLSGEQLIFSNTDLLQSRIRNYKRMDERRISFAFGVTYETAQEKLKKIPGIVEQIIKNEENARFDRAHFKGFGNSSLDFEVVYYVTISEYKVYMDIQQSINFALFESFQNEGIEFAYPTQTLYVNKQD